MAVCEAGPLACESVKVWCFCDGVAIAGKRVGAHLVRHEQHDVGPLVERATTFPALPQRKLRRGGLLPIQVERAPGHRAQHASARYSYKASTIHCRTPYFLLSTGLTGACLPSGAGTFSPSAIFRPRAPVMSLSCCFRRF